jgi:hypothetical protein
MFTAKEFAWFSIAALIFWFIIDPFTDLIQTILLALIAILILLVHVSAKKLMAHHYNIEIEHSIFSLQQFGFRSDNHFKKPIPIGLILPFLLALFSSGLIQMFTLLQFDAQNLRKKRALKKRETHRNEEINESDLAFTAVWGFYALLALSLIGTITGTPELTTYSIYYGAWNLIPFGQLDGTKVFFGNLFNWTLLIIFYGIGIALVTAL